MRVPGLPIVITGYLLLAVMLAAPVAAVDVSAPTPTPGTSADPQPASETPAPTPPGTATPSPAVAPTPASSTSQPPAPAPGSAAPVEPDSSAPSSTPHPSRTEPTPGRGAERTEQGILLPNGRFLPPAPADVMVPSIHGEMLREHGARVYRFQPGERPVIDLPDAYSGRNEQAGPGSVVLAAWQPQASDSPAADAALPNGLRREVQGFLPYWMLTPEQLQWLRYDRLSTIAYFSVSARSDGYLDKTSDGGWSGWTSAAMTDVINTAHSRGVKVLLTVTMMSWDGGAQQATLLGNSTYRARLVQEIVSAVRLRNADGVNLDFEPVYTSEREEYTSFVRQLKAGLVNAGVGSYLSVCTMAGAASWATGYDVAGLVAAGAADHLFVMGYDYSWSGSDRAGGVAPMDSTYQLDVRTSVDDHLQLVSGSKLVWGVPYYGRSWPTTSDALNAYTRPDTATSYTRAWYYTAGLEAAAAYGRRWDATGQVPWFATWDSANGTWREGYYDDATSLGYKYDLINTRGLGGTGMWHLLMDQGRTELWELIRTRFGDSTPPAVTGRSPGPGATGVSRSTLVRATFSEPVRNVSSGTFVLHDTSTGTVVSASVKYDAATRTATLSPAQPLAGSRTYKAGLSGSIRDAAGNALSWTSWTFTTIADTTRPTVTGRSPGPGATGVSQTAVVRATFSEPVVNVSARTFVLHDTATGTAVPATVTYDAASRTATLRPSQQLVGSRTYKPGLSGSIRDASGNALSWTSWTFTTAADTTPPTVTSRSPGPGSKGVSRTPTVRVTFSEAVMSVSNRTFVLIDTVTGATVATSVTYDSATRTATLRPSSTLAANRTYKAGVSGSVRDLSGNPLAWTSWTFTTGP